MENSTKRVRYDDARALLRRCFRNNLCSDVPYAIWRDIIVPRCTPKTISLLLQTCKAFKELVDDIGENDVELAVSFKKEDQLGLAMKYLLKCANAGNDMAMYFLGSAYNHREWGVRVYDCYEGTKWYKKAAEKGNIYAMVRFAHYLKFGYGHVRDTDLSDIWTKKVVLSNNSYVIGEVHFFGLDTEKSYGKAFPYFETAATKNINIYEQSIAQYMCGFCMDSDRFYEGALEWYLKSASLGYGHAYCKIGDIYYYGKGVEEDNKKAAEWYKKAEKEGLAYGIDMLQKIKE
jgi:TPR repeat protein